MRHNFSTKSLYIRNLFAKEYKKIEEYCTLEKGQRIQITPEEGKLLSLFIKIHKIKSIVEIGTLYGYSSICMVKALSENGHIYTIENNPQHCKIAKKNFSIFNLSDKISLIEGNALEKLNELSAKTPFDMIFIDADKVSYPKYLDWAELYIKQDGLIVADNTLLFNTVFLESPPKGVSEKSWHAMREFNDRLSDEKKYFSILIPTDEGMTVALKLT
ncbi:putative O-methyltransferase [Wolbachia endosymbiont of Cylisticus convexus]|uniref:O-methyltransferase n=1 Tax=Wolbachia endosymbiont of Cylisticus convexus TaxID=118728 RepID=UPI000DF6CC64|nr:O-methyltransferase [Wolbachia endosymbiont of Cylisticus convexus]RDD33615.1 putative O-methyltransferase [Wolbachia endosymbiont of Cylisticus convexus]RDD35244.1 putative O-methyltransferase [Wolbachia endosymbiont of Cylisticus convexus]